MVDITYANSWVSRPDVCRCCLSNSGTWDVTASYITQDGDKEIYSHMLRECFGITLSLLLQWGPSRMLCGLCVAHLREAINFRKQVLNAEQQFVEFYNRSADCLDVIKDFNSHENTSSNSSIKDEDTSILNVNDKLRRKSKRMHKDQKEIVKVKSESDYIEEDTFKFKNNEVLKIETVTGNDSKINSVASTEFIKNTTLFTRHKDVKQVSERKRVMITCDIILRDTTACPFRHHKSWFQCFFCQQDFMEIKLLRDHTLDTHSNIDDEIKKIKRYPRSLQIEISNLECRHCNLNLTDVITMRRHFVDVHKKVIYNECIADYKVNNSPYTCHLCSKQFHVFRSLTTHLNEHYANCICDVCGKSFLNSKRLKVHKRTHENGQYPCMECGKVLKTKISKANHMESAHSNRIIKCQICFKPMKHYNDRIKHMSEEHNITHKFKCPICGREYNIKHYLSTHIRQTHGHKNKKCTDCGMAFITNHGLKKHMLKHTGVKPFSCTVCCKSYARNYTLKEHMRAHDNEKFLAPE